MTILLRALCLFLLLSCSGCSLHNKIGNPREIAQKSPGCVIYGYGSGKMQCQSQIDPSGEIVILLSELHENTTVRFDNIGVVSSDEKESYILICTIIVNEETDEFLSLRNIQSVILPLEPISVENITLEGEEIFSQSNFKVLMEPRPNYTERG